MKPSFRLLANLSAGAILAMSTVVDAKPKNRVVGTWIMQSSKMERDGAEVDVMGPHPQGQLIFTEDMTFSVVARDSSIPNFASSDRAQGSPEENKTVVMRSLALFGTYAVDANGDFASERVVASTFPNWSGMARDTSSLREVVQPDGDTMIEHLEDPGAPRIRIVWKRYRHPGGH